MFTILRTLNLINLSLPCSRQILSLHDRWNCYRVAPGEGCPDSADGSSSLPPPPPQQRQVFSMRKCAALQNTDDAEVFMSSSSSTSGRGCRAQPSPPPGFRVEGSFTRRNCKISGSDGREAARISRKRAGAGAAASRPVSLGDDVFSLVVQPGVDAATVMAIVVVMDRICRRPYAPMACCSQ